MILFIGDKPSPRMKRRAKAFEGAACENRLMEWIDYVTDHSKLERFFGIKNYQYQIHNKNSLSGLTYSRVLDKFVALGNEASKALDFYKISHFKLPHPSGRNRQINDKEFIAKKLEECKNWLRSQNE